MARKKTSKKNTSKSTSKGTTRKRKYTPKPKVEPVELQQYWNLPGENEGRKDHIEVSENPAEAPASVYVPETPETANAPETPSTVNAPETSETVNVSETPANDDGTKIIDINDYQPVIWMDQEAPAKPAEPEQASAPTVSKGFTSHETQSRTIESERVYEEVPETAPYDTEQVLYDDGAEQIAIDFVGDTRDKRRGRFAARIAGAAFFGVLVLMFVLNTVTKDVLYSDQENRVFQQLPRFSVGNYLSGRFESQLDNYVSDQFAFRNAFIRIKSSTDLTAGQIKANGVIKAKDNYLMEDIVYPDEDSLKADIKALKRFKKKYKKKKMYFMLVPNAANVLADKLPAGVVTHDQNADMDRLFKAVKKMGYTPIDVRKELSDASKKQQVYYRTDHHWTTDGAFAAFQKAAKVMELKSETEYEAYTVKKDFAGTLSSKSGFTNGLRDAIRIYLPAGDKYLNSVIRYKDKKEKTTMYYDMANLDIKDAYTVFGGTNQSLITITTPTRKNRHLLVVKDSYANCFIPFLTQDYRTITIVDPRYYYENIATVIKADEIDDVLFLYNANTFFSDNYMRMMLTNK